MSLTPAQKNEISKQAVEHGVTASIQYYNKKYPDVTLTEILDNQKIERIQHKATRIIPSISYLLYHDRLKHDLYNTIKKG